MQSLNLPNTLASIRILLAPIMLLFFVNQDLSIFNGWHPSWFNYFAALIFVVASITDFFDGFIARAWDQRTELGEILDPLADKMLILAAFVGLMYIDRASVWAIYIILTREFFITGLRVVAVSKGKDVSASFVGKSKTVAQMIAIGFLTMEWMGADILLWIAVGLTLYSGFEYILGYLKNDK